MARHVRPPLSRYTLYHPQAAYAERAESVEAREDDQRKAMGFFCCRLCCLGMPSSSSVSGFAYPSKQTWDAFDFFTVSLTITELSETFNKSKTDITWGITLVLMFRSVGSILFGIAADRFGRKWPFIVNNLLFIILELV